MIHEAPLICFYVFGTNITVQLCCKLCKPQINLLRDPVFEHLNISYAQIWVNYSPWITKMIQFFISFQTVVPQWIQLFLSNIYKNISHLNDIASECMRFFALIQILFFFFSFFFFPKAFSTTAGAEGSPLCGGVGKASLLPLKSLWLTNM